MHFNWVFHYSAVRKYVRGIEHKEEGPGLILSKKIKVPTSFHMQNIEFALQAEKKTFQA